MIRIAINRLISAVLVSIVWTPRCAAYRLVSSTTLCSTSSERKSSTKEDGDISLSNTERGSVQVKRFLSLSSKSSVAQSLSAAVGRLLLPLPLRERGRFRGGSISPAVSSILISRRSPSCTTVTPAGAFNWAPLSLSRSPVSSAPLSPALSSPSSGGSIAISAVDQNPSVSSIDSASFAVYRLQDTCQMSVLMRFANCLEN